MLLVQIALLILLKGAVWLVWALRPHSRSPGPFSDASSLWNVNCSFHYGWALIIMYRKLVTKILQQNISWWDYYITCWMRSGGTTNCLRCNEVVHLRMHGAHLVHEANLHNLTEEFNWSLGQSRELTVEKWKNGLSYYKDWIYGTLNKWLSVKTMSKYGY